MKAARRCDTKVRGAGGWCLKLTQPSESDDKTAESVSPVNSVCAPQHDPVLLMTLFSPTRMGFTS